MKPRNSVFHRIVLVLTALWCAAPLFLGAEVLPVDPQVTVGTLENGLTYYVRENSEPKDRAVLRLVVDVGSLQETEEQLGLAHFTEHMAFNGTEKYAEDEIIEYMESIGMEFGPDVNASTGFDQTVYKLQVPTDTPEPLEKAIEILEQWAFRMTLEGEEIDKERNVIVEEWRYRRGPSARLREQQYPIIFKDSRYAERIPIGEMEVIRSFSYETLRRFYRDWYRPDLMAVIAVGDFDGQRVIDLIRRYFGSAENPNRAPVRTYYEVPDHESTLYAVASDPELQITSVSVYNKAPVGPLNTREEYRKGLVHGLYAEMMNNRFKEIARGDEAPFLTGYAGSGRFVRTKDVYYLSGYVQGNDVAPALEALVTEARRVKTYGFTEGEFKRAKLTILERIDRALAEKDTSESEEFVSEYTRAFLEGEGIPGIEYEHRLYHTFIPEIPLHEVNAVASNYLADQNRVIVVSAIRRDDLPVVSESEVRGAVRTALAKDIEPYVDALSDIPLLAEKPIPGRIVSSEYNDEVAVTAWTLSNGARIYHKQTDFKNDELLFSAYSLGGTSMVPDSEYFSAKYASAVIGESGLAVFSKTELEKKLAGKTVSVSPYVNELEEGLRGSSSIKDAETLFTLIRLYFTSPRHDPVGVEHLRRRLEAQVQNREAQPDQIFFDTYNQILSSYHYRSTPLTEETLGRIDFQESYEVYRERFADPGDFTFFFVGSMSAADLRPLIETYIAGLPSTGTSERWVDRGIEEPTGVLRRTIEIGLEPISKIMLTFHGPYTWNRENNHRLLSLSDTLNIRLREVIREDEGGTYGIGAYPSYSRYPDPHYLVQIYFSTDPARTDELVEKVLGVTRSMQREELDDSYVSRIQETQRQKYAQSLRDNGYWLSVLKHAVFHGRELKSILELPEYIDELSADELRDTARKYLDEDTMVQLILLPEEE